MAANYKAPGVTIKEITNPANISVPGGYNVSAIVATGSSTIDFNNVPAIKASGVDTIPSRLINEVNSIIGIGDYPGFFNYVLDVDFQLINGYQVTWLTANQPALGSTFYISYKKTKVADDFASIRFFDIDDVRKQYGNEVENGVVTSPLTLMALLELEARGEGGGIICVQAADGSTQEFIKAIDKLEDEEVDTILVTGVTNSQVSSYLQSHVNLCSSDSVGKERTTFVAATSITATVNAQGTSADAINNDRVCFIVPPAIGLTVKDAITGEAVRVVVSSVYAGANISGIESNPDNDPATPMLRKKLSSKIDLNGFKYLKKEKNFLASKSCFVLEQDPVTAQVSVFDALTTSSNSPDTQERSVRRIKDRIRKDLRTALDARYIGQKNVNGMESNVQMSAQSLLSNFVDTDVIREARNIKATRNPLDDREIRLSFEILPVYPLKFITISFSIGI